MFSFAICSIQAQSDSFKVHVPEYDPFTIPVQYGQVYYSSVVKVDHVSKDELHSRARAWIAQVYNQASYVVQMDDRVSGKIIGKGAFGEHFLNGRDSSIRHTIVISLKDGKYKIEISSEDMFGICKLFLKQRSNGLMKVYAPLLIGSVDNVTFMIRSLEQAMKSKANDDF